jgi:adenosylcobinamide-phosphate synthase
MSAFTLIFALLLEQFRPISRHNPAYLVFIRFANYIERLFNGGQFRQGVIAWLIAVLPVVMICTGIFWLLRHTHPLLGWLWCLGILYLTMGFRQFSHAFTEVSDALHEGDVVAARITLGQWIGQDASEMSSEEISRIAIEQGTVDSYRYVFGPIFWFVILAPWLGPAGPMLYRTSTLLYQKWNGRPEFFTFALFASKVQYVLDWLPARVTAVSLALMGDFEDAIYCWRTQAANWTDRMQGILLASVGGALGVCLGSVVTQNHTVNMRPVLGVGEEANPHFLRSAVGLIWRTVLLWIGMISLLCLIRAVIH